MFNLHHLHYFYVCAQTGNVTKAAAKLGISQPSLSAQLKQFENHIGMQILVRSGRTLALTPRGKELFEFSSRIFEITEKVERFIKKSEKTREFDLRIGVSVEVERPFVAEVLGRLMKIHGSKKISSTIISGTHDEIVDMLADDQIDVVISNQRVSHAQPFAELKIPVILASANTQEPLRINNTSNIKATLEKLGQSLILPMAPMVLGKETRDYLKKHGVTSVTSLQTNILACIVRAVEEGVGAAFLPVAYVNFQIKKGLLSALGAKDGYWQHTLYLFAEKGNTNEFLNDLVKIMTDLNVLN
jgi:LysR family transcriptional activator of nhaA